MTDQRDPAQVAFVTGASQGLGRHFALTLAGRGYHVGLAARQIDKLTRLRDEIHAAGGRAVAVPLDLTDPATMEPALLAVEEALGPIRVLINNAGVAGPKPALELTPQDIDRVIDTNLKGTLAMAIAAARRMVAQGVSGRIVNVASYLGVRVIGQLAHYCASKAAVIHMTNALALEWARYGIRVNSLAPGYINTEMNADFWATAAGQRLVQSIPMCRLGDLGDLDEALLMLVSEGNRYMTGSNVVVDGGLHVA